MYRNWRFRGGFFRRRNYLRRRVTYSGCGSLVFVFFIILFILILIKKIIL